jgi:hypothetical protein
MAQERTENTYEYISYALSFARVGKGQKEEIRIPPLYQTRSQRRDAEDERVKYGRLG